jgi:nucleotide-binding universal stress UspA family protein
LEELAMPENSKPYVILAAVDYSTAGDLALEKALELATEKRSAHVHVVNVLPVYQAGAAVDSESGSGSGAWAGTLPSVNDAAEQLRVYTQQEIDAFREARRDLDLTFLDTVVAHQRVDVPSEEITRLAGELDADLIVIGTHGRRGLSRVLLGSVAEGTVRLASCPVLVVRAKAAPQPMPAIEPACPRCVEVRRETHGAELWCEQHRERHGQRHAYHQADRIANDANMPLVMRTE